MEQFLAGNGTAAICKDGNVFRIDTGTAEMILCLEGEDGTYAFRECGLNNRKTGARWIRGEASYGSGFSLKLNGRTVSGSDPVWHFDGEEALTLSQGELRLRLGLHDDSGLYIAMIYVAYPDTGVIQSWTEIENRGQDAVIDDPCIFDACFDAGETDDFQYMTGGGNFAGSTVFKSVPVTDGFVKEFDSYLDMETMEVDGHDGYHETLDREQGTAIWFELMGLKDRGSGNGLVLTFDYNGYWKARFSCLGGRNELSGWCVLSRYPFPAGALFRTPKKMILLYSGDEDEMGNALTDYQYRYKWDYTREAYFNRSSMAVWREAPLTDTVFQMVEKARYLGYERIWVDDFWFDAKGLWNGVFGDDWAEIAKYVRRNGMSFRLWMPPWHADRLSGLQIEHPDWMVGWSGWWYNWTLNMEKPEVVDWILNMLHEKQREFGDYDLRVDGSSSRFMNSGSFTDTGGDANCTFLQSEHWYELMQRFKDENPNAGLDGCSSGGCAMTIESIRFADQQQITDGWCFHMGGYWTSLFLPIDKHQGMPMASTSLGLRASGKYGPESRNLFTAPISYPYPLDPESVENCRRDMELFRWLRDVKHVYGKGIKVYRPQVETGDPTFILQRMTEDRTSGMIMFSNNSFNPMTGHPLRVFPKGLLPDLAYTVEALEHGMETETKSGADWMRDGIRLSCLNPGEYLLLNLTGRPGTGTAQAAPKAPVKPEKAKAHWLNRNGIALSWVPGDTEQFISYYEVSKDGRPLTRVSAGCYLFLPDGEENAVYSVAAVNGEGIRSSETFF